MITSTFNNLGAAVLPKGLQEILKKRPTIEASSQVAGKILATNDIQKNVDDVFEHEKETTKIAQEILNHKKDLFNVITDIHNSTTQVYQQTMNQWKTNSLAVFTNYHNAINQGQKLKPLAEILYNMAKGVITPIAKLNVENGLLSESPNSIKLVSAIISNKTKKGVTGTHIRPGSNITSMKFVNKEGKPFVFSITTFPEGIMRHSTTQKQTKPDRIILSGEVYEADMQKTTKEQSQKGFWHPCKTKFHLFLGKQSQQANRKFDVQRHIKCIEDQEKGVSEIIIDLLDGFEFKRTDSKGRPLDLQKDILDKIEVKDENSKPTLAKDLGIEVTARSHYPSARPDVRKQRQEKNQMVIKVIGLKDSIREEYLANVLKEVSVAA